MVILYIYSIRWRMKSMFYEHQQWWYLVLMELTESASRPPSGFWCLNNKMIKELMSFAKCETGKMSYNYVEAICS
jgi:hypothetical protein